MSYVQRLRGRARSWIERRLGREVPAAAQPAEPSDPRLGALAFSGQPPLAPVAPSAGGIPAAWAGVEDRATHRHAWFASMARRGPHGDAEAAVEAQRALLAWLRQDVPGVGAAWVHPSDIAERLVHWHEGLSALGPGAPAELRAAMAGSAAWHLDHLDRRMPTAAGDGHRAVAHHAGAVVGGLTFPGLPGARAAWTEGASGLGLVWPNLVLADGADRAGSPSFLLRSAWLTAVAHAVARANGAALPGAALGHWAQAVWFLSRLDAGLGRLPALGAVPDAHENDGYPLSWSLWNLARGWGLGSGEGIGAGDDPRAIALGLWPVADDPAARAERTHAPRGSHTETKASWALSSFASDGYAVAHTRVRGVPTRLVVHAATHSRGPLATSIPLAVHLDLGDGAVIWGDTGVEVPGARRGPATLDLARVDGKKARVEGRCALGRLSWSRTILLNQQRLFVTDQLDGPAEVRVSFAIPGEWHREGQGNEFTLQRGTHSALVQLSPVLAWHRNGAVFVGSGRVRAAEAFGFTLELR